MPQKENGSLKKWQSLLRGWAKTHKTWTLVNLSCSLYNTKFIKIVSSTYFFVHYPFYMTAAGDYYTCSEGESSNILQMFSMPPYWRIKFRFLKLNTMNQFLTEILASTDHGQKLGRELELAPCWGWKDQKLTLHCLTTILDKRPGQ